MDTINKKILVVDDEPDLREMVKLALSKAGYDVDTAVDGDDCLKKLEEITPDIILLDIMMPGTPVNELIHLIKDINIAFLTVVGISKVEKDELFSQDNIIDYIQKPFDIDDLVQRVNGILHPSKINIESEIQIKKLF